MPHRLWRTALVAALVVLATTLSASAASAKSTKGPKPDVKPLFKELGGRHNKPAFPTFSFSYTDPTDNTTYPITMVGNDPVHSGQPSKMRTVIIPLRMTFVAGGQDTSELNDLGYAGFTAPPLNHTFDGSRRVGAVLKSPIFGNYKQPADMGGDKAQYGDAFMRAQFAKIGSRYHVRLDNVAVKATQNVTVPAQYGLAYQRPVGAWRTAHGMPTDTVAGVADFGWFANYIIGVMDDLHIGPDVVPIFLTDNVMLYDGSYLNCCTIGFHGTPASAATTASAKASPAAQQTLMYAAWSTPGTYSGFLSDYTGDRTAPDPTRGIADIHALSHEVAEHLDDPFVNNAVTPWLTPTAPQYGCTPVLEVGDPVVGDWYPLDGNNTGRADGYQYYGQYHPEEEVFGQWFAHGAMEALGYRSWDGRLTFMGPRTTSLGGPWADFADYSQGC
jgi:hypothetical protein